MHVADHKDAAQVLLQLALLYTLGAQPFGAGAFEKLQVIGVKNDAARISVFPIDSDGPGEDVFG